VAKKQTAIRLNPLTLKALQAEAKRNQETVSDLIRRILDKHVGQEIPKAKAAAR
jgi:predicted DNA-binding protein